MQMRQPSSLTLAPAHNVQRPFLEKLLSSVGLPIKDLPEDLSGFVLALDGTEVVGAAGLEPLGETGLLRSFAVDPAYRNLGLGRQLYEAVQSRARAAQFPELWLITNTAEAYFQAMGFERQDRESAPVAVQAHPQFTGLCPTSAAVMRKALSINDLN